MTDKLVQISNNVWLWPHHPDPERVQPSIGVVVGDLETVLIDAGNSPSVAGKLKEDLKRKDFPPITHVIYTHHHWDHVYGASMFDVQIVAHSSCRDFLHEEREKPWNVEYIEQEILGNLKLEVSYNARKLAIQDWDTFEIVLPEILFEESKTLDLGNMMVELEHVGGRHSEDSIVVKVPSQGVMFLGDCFYPPPIHLRGSDISISISMLASLENEAYSVYIDGHSAPFTRAELREFLRNHQPERKGSSE